MMLIKMSVRFTHFSIFTNGFVNQESWKQGGNVKDRKLEERRVGVKKEQGEFLQSEVFGDASSDMTLQLCDCVCRSTFFEALFSSSIGYYCSCDRSCSTCDLFSIWILSSFLFFSSLSHPFFLFSLLPSSSFSILS